MTTIRENSSIEIVEKRLLFRFDKARWNAVKWDGHPAHQRIKRLDGTKCVDLLAAHGQTDLYFIEVKDYRYHGRAKEKGPLDMEFAYKVRDTVAGLTAAIRQNDDIAEGLLPFFELLRNPMCNVRAVLWLEQSRRTQAGLAMATGDALASRLRWFTRRVFVMSSSIDYARELPGLQVERLPIQTTSPGSRD